MGEKREIEEIFSKAVRAGRRTYFFDVRSTRAGDYYLTMTESKRDFNEDGTPFYRKHKIYLYKEDFEGFSNLLEEMTKYIIDEKGLEVISEIHQKDFKREEFTSETDKSDKSISNEKDEKDEKENFTDVDFDDI